MQQATCVKEARLMLTTSFGLDAVACDELLRTWSTEAHTPVGKIADVLVHQIWEGDQPTQDRALVRFLETRLRNLPHERAAVS
ncbi:hypothetical protein AB0E69_10765 [Kribbella sp. NPDC026611]|uniref:hypothetical protein n=1 Tax=Kribbella sp. NPDC026611 TaxID=3154911 RepID=UPI0033E50BD4